MKTTRFILQCSRRPATVQSSSNTFVPRSSRPLTQSSPLLDFLVPSLPAASLHNFHISSRLPIPHVQPSRQRYAPSIRGLSTTTRKNATIAIHNPQKDDEGQAMTLEITDRAANRLQQIMQKDKNPNLALQITVESGGCHGFQYLMSLISLPPQDANTVDIEARIAEESNAPFAFNKKPKMKMLEEDDVVFAYATQDVPGDVGQGQGLPKVVMDASSLELLKGSKIDYTMELIGSQFKIVDNPLATSSCGCGTSFDVKA